MPKVYVQIVSWNSMKHLPETLASIAAQTFTDFSLIIIDNASTDGVVNFVQTTYPKAMVLRNTQNYGFSRAHNQGITHIRAHHKGDPAEAYVLVTNPDVVLEPDYLEKLVDQVDRRPEVGSACGKLLRVVARLDGESVEGDRTNIIDSAGLMVMKSRRAVDRGAGETDEDARFGKTEEVFGVSGALALYRLSALDDVAYDGQYFDEDFFVYKEDVDLAWRLRLRGWASLYVPRAAAFHYRTAYGKQHKTLFETMFGRQSKAINYYSYRNHLLTLAKNDHLRNILIDMPRIGWYEMQKFGFALLFERATLKGFTDFVAWVPKFAAKRRAMLSNARVRPGEIRKWFA